MHELQRNGTVLPGPLEDTGGHRSKVFTVDYGTWWWELAALDEFEEGTGETGRGGDACAHQDGPEGIAGGGEGFVTESGGRWPVRTKLHGDDPFER